MLFHQMTACPTPPRDLQRSLRTFLGQRPEDQAGLRGRDGTGLLALPGPSQSALCTVEISEGRNLSGARSDGQSRVTLGAKHQATDLSHPVSSEAPGCKIICPKATVPSRSAALFYDEKVLGPLEIPLVCIPLPGTAAAFGME